MAKEKPKEESLKKLFEGRTMSKIIKTKPKKENKNGK